MRWLQLACVALLAAPGLARAEETYYVAVFGSQRPDVNRPKYAHSFGVFVRATPDARGAARLDFVTISWLPERGYVQPVALLPEAGKNFDLHTTLRLALDEGTRVSMWGPYRIDRELYCRAVRQAERLASGEVRYKAVDTGYPTARVSNCIHALSDIVEEQPRLRIASPGWGEPASYYITMSFRPWLIDRCQTQDWLIDALKLRDYPITRRNLEEGSPAESVILRGIAEFRQRRLTRSE